MPDDFDNVTYGITRTIKVKYLPDVGSISDYFDVVWIKLKCADPNVKTFTGDTSTMAIDAPMST